MRSTIIISTMGRYNSLLRLLDNLVRQSCLPEEVIVIEASGFDWRETQYSFPFDFSVIYAEGISLSEARECGRLQAAGDVYIFLDDDVIIPNDYVEIVKQTLSLHPAINGVGGIYREVMPENQPLWKTIIARALGIVGDGTMNKVLESGWGDNVRNKATETETYAHWLFGCNWAVRSSVFQHPEVKIETRLRKWSFLEDLIFGHRLTKNLGLSLKILPKLAVIHDPDLSSGELSAETIRMRFVYRYVFWKVEVVNRSFLGKINFARGMLATTLLVLKEERSVKTLVECVLSIYFILFRQPQNYTDCNEFIFARSKSVF